jgi:hypothetical protein
VELLSRVLHGTRHPVVDLAQGDRVENGPHGFPVTPANRGHPKCRRIDPAHPGKHLDAIRVLRAYPGNNQRNRQASLPQIPYTEFQLHRPIADDDLIVSAIPLGQLPVEDLLGASVTADDDDGRLCPRGRTAHCGSRLGIPGGGQAG